ncbi:putative PilT domain protein [Desulfosarcina variabilis str. Montpellier]|uniref:PIN domain-containing protein n=1 Tax=Desulfosarcina variabilis TaxID=2300 RepID=UPI003AFAB3C1
MTVLVDSSVWIDYFRSGASSERLDNLIDENLVATNNLILVELVPYLQLRNQRRIVELLYAIENFPLTIRWNQLIEWQYQCLKQGFNGIGIPDLIIAQNARHHQSVVYSLDSHFKLIQTVVEIDLY